MTSSGFCGLDRWCNTAEQRPRKAWRNAVLPVPRGPITLQRNTDRCVWRFSRSTTFSLVTAQTKKDKHKQDTQNTQGSHSVCGAMGTAWICTFQQHWSVRYAEIFLTNLPQISLQLESSHRRIELYYMVHVPTHYIEYLLLEQNRTPICVITYNLTCTHRHTPVTAVVCDSCSVRTG